MRLPLRSACALMFGFLLAAGCSPVREDRSINFTSDGAGVGFQHGQDGVYVAASQGTGLKKIFQPTDDMIAVSSPLFSPTDRRLIFTTAKTADGSTAQTAIDKLNPAGALYMQCPVVYTCWLRGPKDDDKPEPLFTAECDHVGYVAANLAVRWHPSGERVLFLGEVPGGQHTVFEFDPATKAKRQVCPKSADALIFDFAPDKEHLVCVMSHYAPNEVDGIWIGKPGSEDWWHVPNSSALAASELGSRIEQLRASKPAWTADCKQFAFVSCQLAPKKEGPAVCALYIVDFAARTVQRIAESDEPFRDLHWSPDGKQLGVVEGQDAGKLRTVRDGVLGGPLPTRPVRSFAGWQPHGGNLCYIAADSIPDQDPNWHAFLFVPDPLARDAVFLAGDSATEAGREMLSGMRITFPQWSPMEEKLSLWATFAPTQRSCLGMIMGSALRPGDPAAVVDLTTGQMSWLAVSGYEKAQVGHYFLLKRDFAHAWHWYEEARKGPPPVEDFSFFEYICLTKLGRQDEASARLDQFRKNFTPTFGRSNLMPLFSITHRPREQWLKDLGEAKTLTGQLLRDLYEAEVFLSLDLAAEGENFFRQELTNAQTDEQEYSRAIALAQLFLVQQKNAPYADLMSKTALPLLEKLWDPAALQNFGSGLTLKHAQQVVLAATAGLTLLPLADPQFLATLPKESVQSCVPHLIALAEKSKDDLSRHGIQMLLFAVYRKLGMEKEQHQAAAALKAHDASFEEEQYDAKMKELLGELRKGLQMLAAGPASVQ
jgi:hypothetical protein